MVARPVKDIKHVHVPLAVVLLRSARLIPVVLNAAISAISCSGVAHHKVAPQIRGYSKAAGALLPSDRAPTRLNSAAAHMILDAIVIAAAVGTLKIAAAPVVRLEPAARASIVLQEIAAPHIPAPDVLSGAAHQTADAIVNQLPSIIAL